MDKVIKGSEKDALLQTKHHFCEGVYAKQLRIPAGHYATSHKHAYSHMSILAQGCILLVVDGKITQRTAPAVIEIAANSEHCVHALTDVVWFCIHPTEETDASKVDDVLIKKGN